MFERSPIAALQEKVKDVSASLRDKIPNSPKSPAKSATTTDTNTTTTKNPIKMPTVLGKEVGPIGYGLMGFTWRPTQIPDDQAFAAMKAALAAGSNLWNGGEFYGPPDSNSLHLLHRYFKKYPEDADKVVLIIKGCMAPKMPPSPDSSPEGVRRSVENCVKILDGVKKIDIFEPARIDTNVPIETTLDTFAELIKEGKIGGVGLSECSAETLDKAAKKHPIATVELEVSLWEDNVLTSGTAETAAKHRIPLIAYSPIGRGFLTGQIKSPADIPEGDIRGHMPRFSEENFPKNLELVEKLKSIAQKKGCTPAQLAISWVRQLSEKKGYPTFIPIPGAAAAERVKENMQLFTLTPEELTEVDKVLSSFSVAGDRYPKHAMAHLGH